MIKDYRQWEEFERALAAQSSLSLPEKYRTLQALYDHAVKLGGFPLKNPLEGIEVDIERSRIFNSIRRAS